MKICDAHNDLLMNLHTKAEIQSYLTKYCNNNKVVKIFTAYYVSPNQEKCWANNEILDDMRKKFCFIEDISQCVPTMENIGFVDNFRTLEQVIKLKPFCVSLTWNFDNQIAGGAFGQNGISDFGREVINILEENKILIDTAHLNKKSFMEFADLTKYPILCTHTSSKEVYNIPRAIDSEQMKIIKQSNGFVGLCLYSTLLSDRRATNKDILKHINSFLENLDLKNIGLGTDFNATGECNPVGYDIDYNGVPHLLEMIKKRYGTKFCRKFAGDNLQRMLCI